MICVARQKELRSDTQGLGLNGCAPGEIWSAFLYVGTDIQRIIKNIPCIMIIPVTGCLNDNAFLYIQGLFFADMVISY